MAQHEMTKAKPRIGRPPKTPATQRSHRLAFRCTDAVLDQLQTAARNNGRTLSEETEFRLLASFHFLPVEKAKTLIEMVAAGEVAITDTAADHATSAPPIFLGQLAEIVAQATAAAARDEQIIVTKKSELRSLIDEAMREAIRDIVGSRSPRDTTTADHDDI